MAILDLRLNPSKGELRWFGLTMLAFSVVVAGMVYWHAESRRVAVSIIGVGAALSATFYALRPLRLPIYRVWMRALYPIGWLISHVVLIVIFYLVLTPIGLVLRLVGYDPLARRFDSKADSYWNRRDPVERPDRYFRQY
jgi:ABC-type uncharacterized transport system permease subunit